MFNQTSSGSSGTIVTSPALSTVHHCGCSARLIIERLKRGPLVQQDSRVEAFLDDLQALRQSVKATEGEALEAVSGRLEVGHRRLRRMSVPRSCGSLRDITVRQCQVGIAVLSTSTTLIELAQQLTTLANKLATRKRSREAMDAKFRSLQEEMRANQMRVVELVQGQARELELSAQSETRKLQMRLSSQVGEG